MFPHRPPWEAGGGRGGGENPQQTLKYYILPESKYEVNMYKNLETHEKYEVKYAINHKNEYRNQNQHNFLCI